MDKTTLNAVAAVLNDERQAIEARINEVRSLIEAEASGRDAANKSVTDLVAESHSKALESIADLEKRLNDANDKSATVEMLEKNIADLEQMIRQERGIYEEASDELVTAEINSLADEVEKAIESLSERLSTAELRSELALDHTEVFARIDKTVEDYTRDFTETYLGEKIAKAEGSIDARFEVKAREIDEEVKARLETVQDGKDGINGRDGVDRQLIQPIEIEDDQQVKKGSVVYHRGGLFQAVRDVAGNPDRDPHGWSSICDGIADVYHGFDKSEGKHSFEIELTTGKKQVLEFDRAPAYLPPGEHKSVEGDFYLDGTVLRLFRDEEWLEVDLRGSRGRKGYKGDDGEKGEKGLDGVGIADVMAEKNMLIVELTNGEVKELLLDIAVPEEKDIDAEIKRYAGDWHTSKSYAKGDVVTSFDGLWLCLKNTKEQPSGLGDSWTLMHGGGSGGGGGGGGGGGVFTATGSYLGSGAATMNGKTITGLPMPRPGLAGLQDAASRQYVDSKLHPDHYEANSQAVQAYTGGTTNAKLSASMSPIGPQNGSVIYVGWDGRPGGDNTLAGIWRMQSGSWVHAVDLSNVTGGGGSRIMRINAAQIKAANPAGTVQALRGNFPALFPALGFPQTADLVVVSGGGASDAQYNGSYIYDGTTWVPVGKSGQLIEGFMKALTSDADAPTAGLPSASVQFTTEIGRRQIKAVDATSGLWDLIYDEDQVHQWISAGSLFRGTVDTAGLAGLPTPGATNVGWYFTWTGNSNHLVAPGDAGIGTDLNGRTLQVGDWIQVAPGATPGSFIWTHVPGDLLSRQRWLGLGSFQNFVTGNTYEQDSLVRFRTSPGAPIHYYRSSAPILATDAAPGAVGSKWVDITPQSAISTLSDVDYSTPQANQILSYDAIKGKWVVGDGQVPHPPAGDAFDPSKVVNAPMMATLLLFRNNANPNGELDTANDFATPKDNQWRVIQFNQSFLDVDGDAWYTAITGAYGGSIDVNTIGESITFTLPTYVTVDDMRTAAYLAVNDPGDTMSRRALTAMPAVSVATSSTAHTATVDFTGTNGATMDTVGLGKIDAGTNMVFMAVTLKLTAPTFASYATRSPIHQAGPAPGNLPSFIDSMSANRKGPHQVEFNLGGTVLPDVNASLLADKQFVLATDKAGTKYNWRQYKDHSTLANLDDVQIVSPNPGDRQLKDHDNISWDATKQKWVPTAPALVIYPTEVALLATNADDGERGFAQDTQTSYIRVGGVWRHDNVEFMTQAQARTQTASQGRIIFVTDAAEVYFATGANWHVVAADAYHRSATYSKTEVDAKVDALTQGFEHGIALRDFVNALTSLPTSPSEGDAYLIMPDAVDPAVAGHLGEVAYYENGAWRFVAPKQAETHLIESVSQLWHWNGTIWVQVASGAAGGGGAEQFRVGSIQQSLLAPAQFAGTMSATEAAKWVVADGRSVSGTAYETITGDANVPDLRGAYLRMAGTNATRRGWVGGALKSFQNWLTGEPRKAWTVSNPGNHHHIGGRYQSSDDYAATQYGRALNRGSQYVNMNSVTLYPASLPYTSNEGNHVHTVTGGDLETRPDSFAVNYFIKVN
mgnify:CR=1 FL=1